MISRRNIRVKVMQTLYVLETLENQALPNEAAKLLQKQFDLSAELFVFLIYFLTEVARYAETDSRIRSSRHLPTQEDRNVNVKIAGNELLWSIIELPSYKTAVSQYKPQLKLETEVVRKLYHDLAESEEY